MMQRINVLRSEELRYAHDRNLRRVDGLLDLELTAAASSRALPGYTEKSGTSVDQILHHGGIQFLFARQVEVGS